MHKEKVVLIERLIPSETEIEVIVVPKLKVLCLASCKKWITLVFFSKIVG